MDFNYCFHTKWIIENLRLVVNPVGSKDRLHSDEVRIEDLLIPLILRGLVA